MTEVKRRLVDITTAFKYRGKGMFSKPSTTYTRHKFENILISRNINILERRSKEKQQRIYLK